MRGYGSLVYWSCESSHFSSYHIKENGISEDKNIEVPMSDGRCGHRYFDTIHYSSRNHVFIVVVMVVEVYLGLKRLATLPLTIVEFIVLVAVVEVDPGLNIPATLPLKIADQ